MVQRPAEDYDVYVCMCMYTTAAAAGGGGGGGGGDAVHTTHQCRAHPSKGQVALSWY